MSIGCGVDRACDACACAPSLLLRCSRLDAETFLSHTPPLKPFLPPGRVFCGVGRGQVPRVRLPLFVYAVFVRLAHSDLDLADRVRQRQASIGILFTESVGGQNRLFLAKGAASAVVMGNKPFSDRALFPPICPKPPKSHANLPRLAKVSTCKLMKSQQ